MTSTLLPSLANQALPLNSISGKNGEPKLIQLSDNFTAAKPTESNFKTVVAETKKEKSTTELTKENEALTKRVAYLEAEVAKRDAKIKELSG